MTAIYLLGLIILFAAPGNFARAAMGPQSFHNHDISVLLQRYMTIASRAWDFISPALMEGAWCGLFIGFLPAKNKISRQYYQAIICLLLGFASLVPFVMIPDFADTRVYFYPTVFAFFASVLAFYSSVQWAKPFMIKKHLLMLWPIIGLFLTLRFHYGYFRDRYETAKLQSQEIKSRREIFLDAAQKGVEEVVVDPLPVRPGFYHADLTTDPGNWVNQGTAKFYNLKSVKTSK